MGGGGPNEGARGGVSGGSGVPGGGANEGARGGAEAFAGGGGAAGGGNTEAARRCGGATGGGNTEAGRRGGGATGASTATSSPLSISTSMDVRSPERPRSLAALLTAAPPINCEALNEGSVAASENEGEGSRLRSGGKAALGSAVSRSSSSAAYMPISDARKSWPTALAASDARRSHTIASLRSPRAQSALAVDRPQTTSSSSSGRGSGRPMSTIGFPYHRASGGSAQAFAAPCGTPATGGGASRAVRGSDATSREHRPWRRARRASSGRATR